MCDSKNFRGWRWSDRLRGVWCAVMLFAGLFLPSSACSAQSANNPGVVEIASPQSFSQVLAVSDVHGMYSRLLTLLSAAKVIDGTVHHHWSGGKTLIIVCGDSIDKGTESLPVLLLWKQLTGEAAAHRGRVVVLLGNHEAEFLAAPSSAKTALFQAELNHAGLLPADVAAGKDAKGIGGFLRAMPLAARVGTFLFSHAGWFPPNTTWNDFSARAKSLLASGRYEDAFLTGPHSILEEKDEIPAGSAEAVKWYDDPAAVQSLEQRITNLHLYGVVFGHQPHAFGFKGKIGGVDALHIIKIDSGMAPDGDNREGEMLRFPHPDDLLHFAMPKAERLRPDGTHAKIEIRTIAP